MRFLPSAACLLIVAGCAKPAPPPASSAPSAAIVAPPPAPAVPPPIPGLPSRLTVKQRTQTSIPGSDLILSIDDITHGRVLASIRTEKSVLLPPVSLKSGQHHEFEYQQRKYELTLVELNNALIGEDFATFQFSQRTTPTTTTPATVLSEKDKIERLITKIESLQGARFIRNGAEHTPTEAAKHLREKRDFAGDKLRTADQFIEQIASRSSLSGDEYEIRFSDGTSVKAGDFLKNELKAISPSPTSAPSPTP